jgi:tRNA threonylcarbamoyladenosine biosynthesis protein TsaE
VVELTSESDTQAWTQALAEQAGLAHAVLALRGDLGAGKTTLVRHLLRAMGVQGRVKSPTYAVVEPHDVPPSGLWPQGLLVSHFDFYRFSDPREWEDAGFRDVFAAPGLKLVEWPDKAGALMPTPDLDLHLAITGDNARRLTATAHTPTGVALLKGCAR